MTSEKTRLPCVRVGVVRVRVTDALWKWPDAHDGWQSFWTSVPVPWALWLVQVIQCACSMRALPSPQASTKAAGRTDR